MRDFVRAAMTAAYCADLVHNKLTHTGLRYYLEDIGSALLFAFFWWLAGKIPTPQPAKEIEG